MRRTLRYPSLMRRAWAATALLAAACSTLPRGTPVPGGDEYHALPSAVFAHEASVTQSVAISGENSRQFLLQTEVDPAGLRMAGLTAFGQKLFELQYLNDALTVHETPFLHGALVPEKLFADFQLIYWPGALLRDLFANTNVEVLETTSGQGSERRFRQGGLTIVDIRYSRTPTIESDVVYRNLRQGYTMRIETFSNAGP